jgi:hypothetical protein
MSQAENRNTTIPSRRAFLAGAPAVAAAVLAAGSAVNSLAFAAASSAETPLSALAPALAAPSPDAGLLKLIEDYRTAKAEVDRAGEAYTLFETL